LESALLILLMFCVAILPELDVYKFDVILTVHRR